MNILLVDDDEVDRLAVVRALRSAGLETTLEETDGVSSAAEALRERRFDCVLLDYLLPEGDGLDVLRTVRQAGVDTPVIILTGRGDEQTAVELMKAGAADYVPKQALSPDRLAQSLRYVIERHRLQKERDQLLDREQQARTEAERANIAKDQFLAVLSHELRTPLNSIMGWAKMLEDRQLEQSRIAHAVAVIVRNAKVQARLINDLLDVSRIISGKLDVGQGLVDPAAICEAALDTLRPQLDQKHVKVEKVLESTTVPIPGDAARLQQVVWNLLSNAVKFSPHGGVIRLLLRRRETAVEIVVEDDGCGIHPDFLPRVFDRFSQASGAATSSKGGLGLGLAIVRHLVELHGGTVCAESEGEGHGARFIVRLPAGVHAAPPAPAASRTGPLVSAQRLEGVGVLFVDDNADARELVRTLLEDRGATITTSDSKDAALATLERSRPDVLISDIEMPDGNGYELIRALRLREEDTETRIPAIALTGTTRADDRIRMFSAGFQLHVPKPVDPTELVAAIASLLARSHRADSPARAQVSRDDRP